LQSKNKQTLTDSLAYLKNREDIGITFIIKSNEEQFLSYGRLYHAAERALGYLQNNGVAAGNELVLQIDDNKTFVIVFWACILGGIIPVPLSIGISSDQKQKLFNVGHILQDPFVAATSKNIERLKSFAHNKGTVLSNDKMLSRLINVDNIESFEKAGNVKIPNPDNVAFLQFSSGSTGSPKGVVLTHRNLLANMEAIAKASAYVPSDSLLNWMPLTHDMGMIGFHLNPIYCELNQYHIPTSLFIRQPGVWMKKASEHRATVLCSPNFGYRYTLKYAVDFDRSLDLSCVRIIYNGAEPVSDALCAEFNHQLSTYGLKPHAMCPVYGLAEASVAVSISNTSEEVNVEWLERESLEPGSQVQPARSSNRKAVVNLGRVIENCSIRITDEQNRVLPDGVVGIVRIKGLNVTQAYYKDEVSTNLAIDADGWLNTGDLGFIKDGDLFITGRLKDVFFINGQNFYSHDIESESQHVPGIELNKLAVAGVFNEKLQTDEVIAFVQYRGELSEFIHFAEQLKSHLRRTFGFELANVIPVKEIPKTTSGKLQRHTLIKNYTEGLYHDLEATLKDLSAKANAAAIANDLEYAMIEIWNELFESDGISPESNFFQLGGNSLEAIKLSMAVQRKFNVDLAVDQIYELQTIRSICDLITVSEVKQFTEIPVCKKSEYCTLAPSQRRLYFAWRLDNSSVAYNLPVAFSVNGKIDRLKLQHALQQLVNRHESLRMTFLYHEQPLAKVHDFQEAVLEHGLFDDSKGTEQLNRWVRPFDLTNGPLFRFVLIQDKYQNDKILFLDFHHIVSDGHSVVDFVQDMLEIYKGNTIDSIKVSYRDFIAWENTRDRLEIEQHLKDFWITKLRDTPSMLAMPEDFNRPAVFSRIGRTFEFCIDTSTSEWLGFFAASSRVTLHDLIFTLYSLLLSKFSGQDELIIGLPVQGRLHPDLMRIFGMFVNNLPIRVSLHRNNSFRNSVRQVANALAQALHHQDIPFDKILDSVKLTPDASRNPLFDTMLTYQQAPSQFHCADFVLSRFSFDPGFSKFDLSFRVINEEGSLSCSFEYSADLFKPETISGLADCFQRLIKLISVNPDIKLAELSLLNDDDYRWFIETYNDTGSTISAKAIHQLFYDRVLQQPAASAILYRDAVITYSELNEKAELLAKALLQNGMQQGSLVGLFLQRSPELIIAILGVLKAGGAYLPLDTELPQHRVNFLINDSRCHLVLCFDANRTKLPEQMANVMTWEEISRIKSINGFDHRASPNDLAYVIYTSGTSGNPKGVMIEHRALVNYVSWAGAKYCEGKELSFPLYSSISFDLTITSIFVPLLFGHKIVIYEDDNESLIEKVVNDNIADILKLTPSHLRLLLKNNLLSAESKIKTFIVGGEAFDSRLARELFQATGEEAEIFNEYGPTESTVGCMVYKFNPDDDFTSVPIGVPISNNQIYLLDKYLKPVHINAVGDIYVSGTGLARGYLFNDHLTNEKFIKNPFKAGQRMYATGDLGRRLPSGDLLYIGRRDSQVKINGHRIELSEIENQLLLHDQLENAAVTVDANTNLLLAYCSLKNPSTNYSVEKEVRKFLVARLPHYMIPAKFIFVRAFPLTQNGKIDFALLKKSQLSLRHSAKAATTEVEQLCISVWEEVLKTNPVTTHDNFFELGGDSIKAIQVASKLHEMGLKVKAKDILTYHTIEQVILYIEERRDIKVYDQQSRSGSFKLTPIQKWFFNLNFKHPGHYNQSVLLDIKVPLNVNHLSNAFAKLVEHHDALRVNFDIDKKELFYNNNHLKGNFILDQLGVSNTRTVKQICESYNTGFDIVNDRLVKAALISDNHRKQKLFIVAHHLVVDGVSWRILLKDLLQSYNALELGMPLMLPLKTAAFKDWSDFLHSGELPVPNYTPDLDTNDYKLPQDFETDDRIGPHLTIKFSALNEHDTRFLLRESTGRFKTNIGVILNAAAMMALNEWIGVDKCTIEQEGHGRDMEKLDVSRTVGWFTALFPVRLRYYSNISELLQRTGDAIGAVPLDGAWHGVANYIKSNATAPNAIVPLRINYLGHFSEELDNSIFTYNDDFGFTDVSAENALTAQLEISAMVIKDKLKLRIAYDANAYQSATIDYFTALFVNNILRIICFLKEQDWDPRKSTDFAYADLKDEDINLLFK
jgi:amino acid adenylation domain-containing protein/non-ribosomal peptide synthase protein (TIGR01720 family)